MIVTLNSGDYATANRSIDATFANRGGFHYLFTESGASSSGTVRMVAYQSSPGAAVDIYIAFYNYYNQASYTILEAFQDTYDLNPTDTLGNLPPDSTIVFDSNNPIYKPVTYSNFASQFGVGTAAPQKMLSVAGDMNADQNDANNGSTVDFTLGYASGEGMSSARVPGSPNLYGLDFYTAFNNRLSITQGGAVGIGTKAPTSLLEVAGDVKLSNGGQLSFPDGTHQSTAFNPNANVSIGVQGGQASLNVGGTVTIGSAYKGDAALHISNPEGCCNRMTQIAAAQPSGDAINIMASMDAMSNWHWFTWGVTNSAWAISPGVAFGVPAFTVTESRNVGINTSSPTAPLEVNGNVKISSGVLQFADGSTLSSAAGLSALTSTNEYGLAIAPTNIDPAAAGPASIAPVQNTKKLLIGWNRSGGDGEQSLLSPRVGALPGGFGFYDLDPSGSTTRLAALNRGGMALNGNLALSNGAHINFPDSTQQSTAWTGVVPSQDYADSVDVTGTPADYEPGDVLAIDPARPRSFVKAAEPYSNLVGGVYSTKPGLLGRRSSKEQAALHEVPLALNGIVPTKVSTENGPVKIGDLLVTSSRPGYAMRGTDRSRLTGAVLGKALGSIGSGAGVIDVLVSLQ